MNKFYTIFFLFIVLSLGLSAQTLRLEENFNYGTANDTTLPNWTRHSGTMGPNYSAAGLTYTGHPGSGIGGAASFTSGASGVNDGDVHRTFDPLTTSGNIYVSFLLRLDSARTTGDYFFHLGPNTIGTVFRLRVFARDSSGANGFVLGLSKSNEAASYATTALNYNQTYFVIAKYLYNTTAANDDQVQLYVYASGIPASEPGSPIVTLGPVGTGTASDPVDIGSVAIRQGTNTPTGRVDAIRVSTMWDQVIPVELTSFTAITLKSGVQLKWSTSSEVNNKGFDVERRAEGKNWSKIGYVEGKGTTTENQNYLFVDKNIASGKYQYRLKQVDFDGTVAFSQVINVEFNSPVTYELLQNYPNPFNPSTKINYSVAQAGLVTIKVYNMLGQEIRTLVNGHKDAGNYSVDFNADNLFSGVYFYKIEAGNFVQVKKMTLIK
jgi:hypothetical protein